MGRPSEDQARDAYGRRSTLRPFPAVMVPEMVSSGNNIADTIG